MITINDRIAHLISKIGTSKTEFAKKINVSQQYVSKLTKDGVPSDRTISDICREFNVSEKWLRYGQGEIFPPRSREEDVARAVEQLLNGESSEFKRRFTLVLSNLKEEHWALLEEKLREIVEARPVSESEGKKISTSMGAEESATQPKAIKMPRAKKHGNMVEIRVYDQPAAAGLGNYLDDPDFHIEQYPEYILPSGTDFGILIDGDSMEPKIHNGYTVFVRATPIIDPGQIGVFVLNGKSYCKKLTVDHEKRQTLLVSLNPKYEDIVIQEFDSFRTLGHVLGQWGPGSREDDFLDW